MFLMEPAMFLMELAMISQVAWARGRPRRGRKGAGRAGSGSDLRRERPSPRGRGDVRGLTHDHASNQPDPLGRRHPFRPGAGARRALGPVVRGGERRQVRATGRPVPDHHRLPEGEHDAEHHAQHGDHPDTPDGGRPAVRAPRLVPGSI